ncbi:YidH family protein [Chamaesiphon sp.]|uniref:YidH family protein n=1 Tax=Chamaesiphon sp. TaxID=2814140 RepID=UPI00359458E2
MTQDPQPKIDRQREHQANERTFLAWLRTSIALIGFGFAISRFGLFLRQIHLALTQQEYPTDLIFNSENLGIGLVVVGIVTIAIAAWRYSQVLRQIERGNYRPSPMLIWVVAVVVMILGSLSIPLVLWRTRVPKSVTPKPVQPQLRQLRR